MKNTISEPKISTLTVELKVVRIGNKQMTKAVFNQLYEDDFFDEEFNILYPLWGIVKDNNSAHEFLIFQAGNSLKKYGLTYVDSIFPRFYTVLSFHDYLLGGFDHSRESSINYTNRKKFSPDSSKLRGFTYITENEGLFEIEDGTWVKVKKNEYIKNGIKFNSIRDLEEYLNKNLHNTDKIFKEVFTEEQREILKKDYKIVRHFSEKRKAIVDKIYALDQLFIAV